MSPTQAEAIRSVREGKGKLTLSDGDVEEYSVSVRGSYWIVTIWHDGTTIAEPVHTCVQ